MNNKFLILILFCLFDCRLSRPSPEILGIFSLRDLLNTNTLYSVGGTVSGMVNAPLVLDNNSGDSLTVNADGNFTFSTKIKNGNSFAVTVGSSPEAQSCAVSKGSGTVSGADIKNISISCSVLSYVMFLTDFVNGNLGGVTGADTFCNASTNKPSGRGTFKAFLTGGPSARIASESPDLGDGQKDWVLKKQGMYFRADLITKIAQANSKRLFDFPLTNSVSTTPSDFFVTSFSTSANWVRDGLLDCNNWTSGSNGVNGSVGDAFQTDSQFIYRNTRQCDLAANDTKILCVEQ